MRPSRGGRSVHAPRVPGSRRRGAAGRGVSGRRGRARPRAGRAAGAGRRPSEVAADEDFWREIQQAFTVDRSLINLNNGGVCPSPRIVQEAMKRYLDFSNEAPVYTMWQLLEPQIESVRARPRARCSAATPRRWRSRATPARRSRSCQLGLDLKPRRRGAHHRPGLPAHAHDLAPARAPRRHRAARQISFPVPPPRTRTSSCDRFEARDHAAHEA